MDIGELITAYRKDAGMTIDELVASSGVSRGTITKIISGVTKAPTLDNVKAIARALGRPLADFDDDISQIPEFSFSEREHIKKYRFLDPYGQETVDAVLEIEYRRCNQSAEKTDTAKADPENLINLIEYLIPVSAGTGIDLTPYDSNIIKTNVISNIYTERANLILRVDGESMAPRYHDGDKILVQETGDVDIGEIGVWRIENRGYVKKKGEHCLISLNKNYDNIYPEDFQEQDCVGRVIGILDPTWIVSTRELDE